MNLYDALRPKDRVVVLAGLLVLKEMLLKSGYPPEVCEEIGEHIDKLVLSLNTPSPRDAYGNPYS